ncbi:expressed unknown protein [Seminavis robusta]|uniref:Sulfotransferase domain-containing protein n=1 Tax=Seminavis robusta TaxID=568900 RepID=A0A9N8DEX6_9STRA|nr:expressed unknown protein [Seminavis robusta]|eukprot:Sro57_g033200.1 n/a (434) ;mRNA; f:30707-32191
MAPPSENYYDEQDEETHEIEALITSDESAESRLQQQHQSSQQRLRRPFSSCLVLIVALIISVFSGSLGFLWGRRQQSPLSASTSVKLDEDNDTPIGVASSSIPDKTTTTTSLSPSAQPTTTISVQPTNTITAPPTPTSTITSQTIKQQQIDNFRRGNGLMLNFHIVHHGGTTFCQVIGRHLKAPTFACLGPKPEDHVGPDYPKIRPWKYNDTDDRIQNIRQYFNMISWEFMIPPGSGKNQINETNWEHPQLVSVFVIREPISRTLAGDRFVDNNWPNLHTNGTLEEWMEFANADKHTDNYALRVLAGPDCCNGTHTDRSHFERARKQVSRFTFVLDIECLDAGMAELARVLDIDLGPPDNKPRKSHNHKPPSERIPYREVYDYLLERNKLDIELYEWAKARSLVNCSELALAQTMNVTSGAPDNQSIKESNHP